MFNSLSLLLMIQIRLIPDLNLMGTHNDWTPQYGPSIWRSLLNTAHCFPCKPSSPNVFCAPKSVPCSPGEKMYAPGKGFQTNVNKLHLFWISEYQNETIFSTIMKEHQRSVSRF